MIVTTPQVTPVSPPLKSEYDYKFVDKLTREVDKISARIRTSWCVRLAKEGGNGYCQHSQAVLLSNLEYPKTAIKALDTF